MLSHCRFPGWSSGLRLTATLLIRPWPPTQTLSTSSLTGCSKYYGWRDQNFLLYRKKFPKLEQKNIQFWFKNRRAKCKRLNNNMQIFSLNIELQLTMQCNGTYRYIKNVCYILLPFLFIADIDEDQKCQVSIAYRLRNCHLSVLKVNNCNFMQLNDKLQRLI